MMEMGIGQNDQQRWEIKQHDQEILGSFCAQMI